MEETQMMMMMRELTRLREENFQLQEENESLHQQLQGFGFVSVELVDEPPVEVYVVDQLRLF